MIIDSHTHAFPPAICRERERFFDNEPAFKLLYATPGSRLVGAGEIIDMMDAQGVDKSILFGFPWRSADTFKANNDYVLDAVHRYPERTGRVLLSRPPASVSPPGGGTVPGCRVVGSRGVGLLHLGNRRKLLRRARADYGVEPPASLPGHDSHQ
jgi:hypothetical protein